MLDALRRLNGTVHSHNPLLELARGAHVNKRGQPMGFEDKPSIVPMYADFLDCEGADVIKAVQTGVSELMIQLALYESGWQHRIVTYVLPTDGKRNTFVQDRVNPLLLRIPVYRQRTPGGHSVYGADEEEVSNLKVKRFGPRGTVMFLGANSPANFVEFSTDTAIVDELDHCDEENVSLIDDRLREAQRPQLFRIGNPTVPRRGIHAAYMKTDRRRWHWRCGPCGERQPLDWFVNVVERADDGRWVPRDVERRGGGGDIRPVCRRCKRPFDRVATGALWVAECPTVARLGYHMSRLDVLSVSLRKTFAEWVGAQGNAHELARFFRSVLGWPYEDGDSRVTYEMIEAAATGPDIDREGGADRYKNSLITAGVDVGTLLHVTISENEVVDEGREEDTSDDDLDGDHGFTVKRRAVFVGAIVSFDDLIEVFRRYGVDYAVIDAMPETRKAKEIRDYFIDHGGTEVWLCRYANTPRVGSSAFGLAQDYDEQVVTVDRTQLLDACLDDIRSRRRVLPADVGTVLGYSDQMTSSSRVLENNRYTWIETGPDHFRHSDAYDRVAWELSQGGAQFLG